MSGLLHEFRLALRSLARSPGFTAVAVATLALGIGANTAVFSLANAVLLRPLPYADPGRLVMVWESAPFFGLQDSPVSPANYVDWKARATSFEEMGALEIAGYRIAGDGPPELALGANVTAGLFRALGTRPLLGRVFTDEDDRPEAARVAVIGEGLWRRRFGGDPGVVGRRIRLGEHLHTIVGVLAAGTEPPSQYIARLGEIWTPLGAAYTPRQWNERGRHNWMVIARLKPGVTLPAADAEMRAIGQALSREYPETNEKVGAFVAPLRDHFVRGVRRTLLLLTATAAFLLLIACSNLANLFLSRAAGRTAEAGIRAALGGGVWQVARRFVWEGVAISLAGSLLGLALATATFRFLAHLAPGDMAGFKSLSLDVRVLAFTAVLSLVVAVAFSLVPLAQARRLQLSDALKHHDRRFTASRRNRTRPVLVGAQVALAFVVAVGAALLMQTASRLRSVDTGFRTSGVLTVGIPRFGASRPTASEIVNWQRDILRRVAALPGVVSAGFTNHVPIAFKGDISGVTTEGRSRRDAVQCRSRTAGPGYMTTMGIPILRGRDIAETDAPGAPMVALVNQTLARELWPDQDPIGRKLVFEAGVYALVAGVVGDIRQDGLDAPPKPAFYISSLQAPFHSGALAIHVRTDPASVAGAVRRAIYELDPQQPVTDVLTISQILDEEVSQRRVQAVLLGVCAGLAVLLAAIGLYGVLAYAVGQRAPEFGVRMALGASPGRLMGRVIGQGLALAGLGLAAGLAAALALTRLLEAFLFGVEPTDPATYAAVAVMLLAAAGLASFLPARRAMRVDPAAALRQE